MISKRLYCSDCELPLSSCICNLGCTINNPIEVLALQHPLERGQSKNSLRLLKICTQNMRTQIGEAFDQAQLQHWLYDDRKVPLLLYPPTAETQALGLAEAAKLPDLCTLDVTQLRLVILDATWKKSRKMLYMNPLLQQLPRLTLVNPPPSIYQIRKAHTQHQLSSLEACCYAWRQLENNPLAYSELLDSFAGFVHKQKVMIEKKYL